MNYAKILKADIANGTGFRVTLFVSGCARNCKGCFNKIAQDPSYGKIVCRCETVTEGDLIDAIRAPIPAVTVDMLKKRLRAGMGRCQGGFCSPRVAALIAEETSCTLDKVTKSGGGSWLVTKRNTDGE